MFEDDTLPVLCITKHTHTGNLVTPDCRLVGKQQQQNIFMLLHYKLLMHGLDNQTNMNIEVYENNEMFMF